MLATAMPSEHRLCRDSRLGVCEVCTYGLLFTFQFNNTLAFCGEKKTPAAVLYVYKIGDRDDPETPASRNLNSRADCHLVQQLVLVYLACRLP